MALLKTQLGILARGLKAWQTCVTLQAAPPAGLCAHYAQSTSETLSRRRQTHEDAPPDDAIRQQKARALQSVLKEVNSTYGKGSIMKLGAMPTNVETTSSGALSLDLALGGGYPKGRIIEIFGPESSGKTTLALHAIAEVQKAGGTACLVDAEHAFDPNYSRNLGLDVENLLLCQPDDGEMALQVVDELARSGAVDLVAVDSVAALVPRSEIEGEMGSMVVGAQARLMSHALRRLTAHAARCACTIVFLNQIRYKIGVLYGNPETTSGGNALKFYASVRLDVRRKENIAPAKGDASGIRVKAKVVKNKCAPPYRTAELELMFGSGIDATKALFEAAQACGVITRRGSVYYFQGENLAHGYNKASDIVAADPAMKSRIEVLTREAMLQKKYVLPSVEEAPHPDNSDHEVELQEQAQN